MIFWQHILNKLQSKQKVYVLTVIENVGSSPGRKGFKMLVAQDKFIFGSIGGGVMEFSLVAEAQKLLQEKNPPTFIKKQIHKGNIKDGSGMICSGEQTVAFHCLNLKDIDVVNKIINCMRNGEKGSLNLTPNNFCFSSKILNNQFIYHINSLKEWSFQEYIGYRDTLYIVGGGHVGVAVSEFLLKLGFYVVVFDNRKNLNTFNDNNYAHKKKVINYLKIDNFIDEGENSYVVIMTHKYTDDKIVLGQLIKKNFKYLGVLGSKEKLKIMWNVFINEGVLIDDLNKVYAPIGLQIKSETTEEIAISIAAQIIKVRNN